MRFVPFASVVAVVLISSVAAGSVLSYDALSGWNAVTNSSSNMWQYGTETTPGGPLTLFAQHGAQSTAPSYDWWSFNGQFLGPNMGFNSSGATITLQGQNGDPNLLVWPANELLIAPGGKNGTPTSTVLRWIAPTTGVYDIAGRWSDLQAATTSMSIMDGTTTLSSYSYGLPDHQADIPFTLAGVPVIQGQAIDFLVNSGGNDFDDVLGISATITPSVPEPGSVALAVFGVFAALLRRRRSTGRPCCERTH